MVKIRCQDCGRIVEVDKDWDIEATCDGCNGYFKESDSKEDTYEEEEEDSNEDELCHICGETELKKDNYISFKEENNKGELFKGYNEITICKKCIDKAYPRQTEVKEVIKFIENPIETSYKNFNPDAKSKFD